MQKNQSKKKKSAFSLIELSIVILIVSILITGALTVSKTSINNSKDRITKERMSAIYDAITNFVATNRRLPCPASIAAIKGTAGYGEEDPNPGTCTGTSVSSGLSYGMVPVRTLNLSSDIAEDGYGTKFSFVVNVAFTKKSVDIASSDGFEIIQSIPSEGGSGASLSDIINIKDYDGSSGNDISNYALFTIISHGVNKYEGYNSTSSNINSNSPNNQEDDNSQNNGTSFDNVFYAHSVNEEFDDILLFKTKAAIVKDSGLEYIMCNQDEAETDSYSWSNNGYYGESVYSECNGGLKALKICGKYGIWSGIQGTSSDGCS